VIVDVDEEKGELTFHSPEEHKAKTKHKDTKEIPSKVEDTITL